MRVTLFCYSLEMTQSHLQLWIQNCKHFQLEYIIIYYIFVFRKRNKTKHKISYVFNTMFCSYKWFVPLTYITSSAPSKIMAKEINMTSGK